MKAALSILGVCDEYCRLPLAPMEAEEKERIAAVLKRAYAGACRDLMQLKYKEVRLSG